MHRPMILPSISHEAFLQETTLATTIILYISTIGQPILAWKYKEKDRIVLKERLITPSKLYQVTPRCTWLLQLADVCTGFLSR